MSEWENNWQKLSCSHDVGLWLTDYQSMTEKLERHYVQLQFQLLSAQYGVVSEAEAKYLSCSPGQRCWRRTVMFGQPYFEALFCILIVPEAALGIVGEEIVFYGSEPIGHLLFSGQDPAVRSAFSFAQLPTQHPYVAAAERYVVPSLPQVFARRSICHYKSAPIMVVDVFLPDLIHEIEQD